MRKVDIKHSHANNMGVLNSSADIRIAMLSSSSMSIIQTRTCQSSLTKRVGCSDLRREWRINNYYVPKIGQFGMFFVYLHHKYPNIK